MTRIAWLALPMFLLAATVARGEPATALSLHHASQDGNTRVVIELSAPVVHHELTLDNPTRVAVDLEAQAGSRLIAEAVDDGRLLRIRVGDQRGNVVRIVFDVDRIDDWRVFELPADGDARDRLVFDFFGPGRAQATTPVDEPVPPPRPATPAPRPVTPPAPVHAGPVTIVLDAGHGGEDPGAHGFDTDEKDICLAIARRVAAEINRRPGYRALLTRDDDFFIPLRGRIDRAQRGGADAFISIHCNASPSRAANGTEVYFLSLSGATDEASRELARLENSADLMGGVAPEADDDLSSILFDMQQTDVQQKGSLLAESVVEALRNHPDLTTRGVKQAGFVVLKSPRIPSILVETAFITNERESHLLRSGTFQVGFARRLADGVVRFFESTALAGLR